MAIVKMSKFNLLVFNSERKNLLQELQKFQDVHFLDLKEDKELSELELGNVEEPESIVAINEEINKVNYAIKTLSGYRQNESTIKTLKKGRPTLEFSELEIRTSQIDYKSICNQVIKMNSKIEKFAQDIDNLKIKINELRPWINLDVSVKELDSLGKVEVLIGRIPNRFKKSVEEDLVSTEYTYFEVLSENNGNIYVLLMTNDLEIDLLREVLRKYNYSDVKIEIESKPKEEITVLNEKVSKKQEKIASYKEALKELSKDIQDLQIVYEYLMNVKLRITESENFLTTDYINLIEGYVPLEREEDFTKLLKDTLVDNIYYFQIEEVSRGDENIPILLENSKFTRSFESLTTMYAYPKYNEMDPTFINSIFYAFFFGMMIADAGYGLILLVCSTIALKAFNLSEDQKNTLRFLYVLSFFIILWGLIYGSFFALTIPTKLLDPGVQYMEVLLISIGFGIIHIYVGLGADAYMKIRDGKSLDALFDTGFWIMALTGAILLLVETQVSIPNLVSKISLYVMIIGMVGIVLTGGRESPSIGGKLGGGLYSLYGISSYIGDFISYSRLMALGLSGGYLAAAINEIVEMLFDTNIIGIVFGLVIFAGGHLFNLFLSALSAYVHDIRLTYVEFFGKFYNGGGIAFKSLRSKPKYFNIVK